MTYIDAAVVAKAIEADIHKMLSEYNGKTSNLIAVLRDRSVYSRPTQMKDFADFDLPGNGFVIPFGAGEEHGRILVEVKVQQPRQEGGDNEDGDTA